MLTSLLALSAKALAVPLSSPARPSVVHLLVAAWRALQSLRRRAAARRQFERLDDAALRDLGVCRSEFDSFWLESHGCSSRTRKRTAGEPSHGDGS